MGDGSMLIKSRYVHLFTYLSKALLFSFSPSLPIIRIKNYSANSDRNKSHRRDKNKPIMERLGSYWPSSPLISPAPPPFNRVWSHVYPSWSATPRVNNAKLPTAQMRLNSHTRAQTSLILYCCAAETQLWRTMFYRAVLSSAVSWFFLLIVCFAKQRVGILWATRQLTRQVSRIQERVKAGALRDSIDSENGEFMARPCLRRAAFRHHTMDSFVNIHLDLHEVFSQASRQADLPAYCPPGWWGDVLCANTVGLDKTWVGEPC